MALTDFNRPDGECLQRSLVCWIITSSFLIAYRKELEIGGVFFCKFMLCVVAVSILRHLYRCNKWLHMRKEARKRNFLKYQIAIDVLGYLKSSDKNYRSHVKGTKRLTTPNSRHRLTLLPDDDGIIIITDDKRYELMRHEIGYRQIRNQFNQCFTTWKKPLDNPPTFP